jgi:UDP-3-O-[3-hydroxymyristoyl] glucosamine N-acyltransferase
MTPGYTVSELAVLVGGVLRGESRSMITGVADVAEAQPHHATWLSNPKYVAKLTDSRAGVVVILKDFGDTPMPAILCERVDRAVAKLLAAFAPPTPVPETGIHRTAVVHPTAAIGANGRIGPHVVIEGEARIGANAVVHAGCYIGRGTQLGDDCFLWPNVVIRDGCIVGHRVIFHPNAVIGADGFGYFFAEGRHQKIPHIGGVMIGDDVEVGACACIDRAKFGYTAIGKGVKIDNLVQIGHNVRVGEHCVFAAQTGISGSVRIGDRCLFGGKTGATDHVTIGDDVRLAGGFAVATKDIPDGLMISGWPAREHRQELRERAALHRLPEMAVQLQEVLARIQRLETSADHRTRGGV